MESTPENVDLNVESIKPPETKQEITESSISPIKKEALPPSDVKTKSEVVTTSNSGIYIQLGIFSDNEKIKSLQQKLNQLNIQTKSETIKVNGADKIRLITDEFKTEALAKEVLIKIKNAGITGIIKKTS
jgi:cell division septation protein DedD